MEGHSLLNRTNMITMATAMQGANSLSNQSDNNHLTCVDFTSLSRIQAQSLQQQQQQQQSLLQQTAAQTSGKNKKLFPQKLWDLINDDRYSFCLRWSEDGQLVYLNRDEFEESYLKTAENQFHTQKAISFVRQMNMYGFRKVDDCYYENDNFKRDCEHLLKNMIRKHPNKNVTHRIIKTATKPTPAFANVRTTPKNPTPFINAEGATTTANFSNVTTLLLLLQLLNGASNNPVAQQWLQHSQNDELSQQKNCTEAWEASMI